MPRTRRERETLTSLPLAPCRAAPAELAGLAGALLLPQAFGAIHLGESFAAYVSVANFSARRVTLVGVRAELQTDKTRAVLHDTQATPAAALAPGERLDVLVEADVKAAGPHTLVCSAAYVDADGERRYLPQYFKFNAANPLAVRTKVRKRASVRSRAQCRSSLHPTHRARPTRPAPAAAHARRAGAGAAGRGHAAGGVR